MKKPAINILHQLRQPPEVLTDLSFPRARRVKNVDLPLPGNRGKTDELHDAVSFPNRPFMVLPE